MGATTEVQNNGSTQVSSQPFTCLMTCIICISPLNYNGGGVSIVELGLYETVHCAVPVYMMTKWPQRNRGLTITSVLISSFILKKRREKQQIMKNDCCLGRAATRGCWWSDESILVRYWLWTCVCTWCTMVRDGTFIHESKHRIIYWRVGSGVK